MRLGYSKAEVADMDNYTRNLALAFEQRATYLRDKRFARMVVSEISKLFRK